MPETEDDLALLGRAARTAGEIALRHFRGPVQVWEKAEGQGPVTEADLAVDAMLREELTAARPSYGWLSEESADDPGRGNAERVFIVDPIDGTRAFIKGETGFSIALAVADGGRVTAAVVHLPARGETYSAALGQGARLDGRPIVASTREQLADANALGASRQFHADFWPGGAPPCNRHFRTSLAWRLCLVAAGRFDLMLTLRDSFEWDIAAGSLIAGEAGAEVTDREGHPFAFNRTNPLQPGVIAAPAALHRQLMALRRGPGAGRPPD